MPCCRKKSNGGDNKSMNTLHSGNAPPSGDSMYDRGGSGGDSQAVDWWRHHLHGNGSSKAMSKRELDAMSPSARKSFMRQQQQQSDDNSRPHLQLEIPVEQKSQTRMEDRDPLQKAYSFQRGELPIRPVNGNMLHPQQQQQLLPLSSAARSSRVLRQENSGVVEVFTPHLDTNSSSLRQQQQHRPSDINNSEEHMAVIARADSMDRSPSSEIINSSNNRFPVDPPGTPTRNDSLRYSKRQIIMGATTATTTTTPQSTTSTNEERRGNSYRMMTPKKKRSLSNFMERKQQQQQQQQLQSRNNNLNNTVMDGSDHLSDVPSDVDSVIKERYLLACQMLKTTMIRKEKSLIPIEKEYIMSLLGDVYDDDIEKERTDGVESVFSEEQVSAIERATLRLEHDPIFQQPELAKTMTMTTPRQLQDPPTLTRTSSTSNGRNRSLDAPAPPAAARNVEVVDKNPHTSTRKPKSRLLKSIMANACNPNSAMGARGEVSHDVHIVVEQDQHHQHQSSLYNEEWDDPELNDRSKDELVRFDGWSFQRSNEYPFLILGADGEDLNPRVMTPATMEALRGFMPYRVTESNFWLKYSLMRDGASLASLLAQIRGSTYTMIGVETNRGEVFGSFTGTPWRVGGKWYGNGEAFLWRLKKPRYTSPRNSRKPNFEREMEVYPYTGYDDLVQYCTPKTIAIGGGDWSDLSCPFDGDAQGIGFMIDGDLAGGETNSCSTFANPRLAKQTTASSEFSITNLEVWTLTPCQNVQDAARMEMQKLFLDEQGASTMRG